MAQQLTGFALIAQTLPKAPQAPGVYLMKNKNGAIIYVGKALSLRKRLANYARKEEFPGYYRHKVQTMVEQVVSLEWMVTRNEKEALLLESNLIKLHKPRYNVDLRDDKTYPYFRLALKDPFPRLHLVRRPDRKDGARYWGPLENVGAARHTLAMLQKTFPLRRCSNRQMQNRSRACLNYEMKRCLAPCVGKIGQEEYAGLVRQIEAFLDGQGSKVAGELEQAMQQAAQAENFELAARLRDRWQALTRTMESQQVSVAEGDADAWGIFADESNLRIAILRMRGGQLISSQINDLSQAPLTPAAALTQGLLTFYSADTPPPPLILLAQAPEDLSLVAEYAASIRQGKVELKMPLRGQKLKLVELANANAKAAENASEQASGQQALRQVMQKLGLNDAPQRMECLDISHLGGTLTVASIVCFVAARPHRPAYRRYQLADVPPADDYAAIQQAFTRRLNSSRPWPELFVIDGGKGQLAIASAVYQQYKKKRPDDERELALASIAKGQEDEPDKIYLPGRKNPVNFRPREAGLALLMFMRDEAHRVAITYQRSLRQKALTRSVLDEVPGLGKNGIKKLWQAFASLKEIKAASAPEICAKAGLNQALASRVESFLANLEALKERG